MQHLNKQSYLTKMTEEVELCPICSRELGTVRVSGHHLVPKSRGGKETEQMHDICHNKIHSLWTNKELDEHYNSPDKILENADMQTFVAWVSKKSPDFYSGSNDTQVRKGKRRR
jgi:hypothetical protein